MIYVRIVNMKNKKQNGTIVLLSIVLIIAIIVLESRTIDFEKNSLRIISDGFFLGGLLLFLYGGIYYIYEGGIFHPFTYIGTIVKERLSKVSTKDFPRYREYVESKQKKVNINYRLIFCLSLLWIGIGMLIGVI